MNTHATSLFIACLIASGAEAAPRTKAPALDHRAMKTTAKQTPRPVVQTAAPSTRAGAQIRVIAAAYSWREESLRRWGRANALGGRQDLPVEGLEQVAVDPTVIPLGSIIEVPGVGRRIATDTGGLVRGGRIDLHWQSVGQGERQVAVRVVRWGGQFSRCVPTNTRAEFERTAGKIITTKLTHLRSTTGFAWRMLSAMGLYSDRFDFARC